MNYEKKSYDEIKDSFLISWGEPKGLGVIFRLMQREATLGLTNDGLWIGPDVSRNSTKLGFYNWEWINRISISKSRALIYVVINDFDNVVKSIVPLWQKLDFYSLMVANQGNEKSIIVTFNQIEGDIQNFCEVINNNNLAEIEIIE